MSETASSSNRLSN